MNGHFWDDGEWSRKNSILQASGTKLSPMNQSAPTRYIRKIETAGCSRDTTNRTQRICFRWGLPAAEFWTILVQSAEYSTLLGYEGAATRFYFGAFYQIWGVEGFQEVFYPSTDLQRFFRLATLCDQGTSDDPRAMGLIPI